MTCRLKSISRSLPAVLLTATLAVACAKGHKSSTPAAAPDDSSASSSAPDSAAAADSAVNGGAHADAIPCQNLEGTWISKRAPDTDPQVITITQLGCESVTLETGSIGKTADATRNFVTDDQVHQQNTRKSYRARYAGGALVIREITLMNGGDLQDCMDTESEVNNGRCLVVERTYTHDDNSSTLLVEEVGLSYDENQKAMSRTVTYTSGVNHVQEAPRKPAPQPKPTQTQTPIYGPDAPGRGPIAGCDAGGYDPNNPYCGGA